jgi:hypothetical protein
MPAIALVSLLAFALLLPILLDEDSQDTSGEPVDPTEPVDPAAPTEPNTGGEGPVPPVGLAEDAGGLPDDDTLEASGADTVLRGGAGDDLLRSTVDGADSEMTGGSGDDTLSVDILIGDIDGNQSSHILAGGSGDGIFEVDLVLTCFSTPPPEEVVTTITDFTQGEDQLELAVAPFPSSPLTLYSVTQEIEDEAGFTDIRILYTDLERIAADIPVIIRVQGVAGLSSEDFTINDGTLDGIGTDGNDTLSYSGDISEGDPSTLLGLAGDDVLIHEARDSSGPLGMEGVDGNDTLIANEVEFGNQTTLDGGAGDDVLRSDLFLFDGGPNGSFDTFITGPGADRIEITTFNVGDPGDIDLGLLGRVTDFTPGEDMIFVDPSQLVREIIPQDFDNAGEDFVSEYEQDFILREDIDGAYTDLEFTFTETGTGSGTQMTGTIRLEGLTGITADDIAFAQLEPQAPLFMRTGSAAGF